MKKEISLNALLIIASICFGLYYGFVANIPDLNALGCLMMGLIGSAIGLILFGVNIKEIIMKKTQK